MTALIVKTFISYILFHYNFTIHISIASIIRFCNYFEIYSICYSEIELVWRIKMTSERKNISFFLMRTSGENIFFWHLLNSTTGYRLWRWHQRRLGSFGRWQCNSKLSCNGKTNPKSVLAKGRRRTHSHKGLFRWYIMTL